MTSEDILEAKDVAKMFKVHTRTIANMVERGELKAFRVGNLLRFRRSDVEDFINKQFEDGKGEEDKTAQPC